MSNIDINTLKTFLLTQQGREVQEILNRFMNSSIFTKEEKNKLATIEENANNYIHPTSDGFKHIPSVGYDDNDGKFLKAGAFPGSSYWSKLSIDDIDGLVDNFSNTLKGDAMGQIVAINNISPIEHVVKCTTSSNDIDMGNITIKATGKNILPYPYATGNRNTNGLTITNNKDGSITINGTASSGTATAFYFGGNNSPLELIPNQEYTISMKTSKKINSKSLRFTLQEIWEPFDSSDFRNVIDEYPSDTNEYHAVYTAKQVLHRLLVTIYEGETFNNVILYPQVELGKSATDFESPLEHQIYFVNDDGTIDGIDSIYPNMTIYTLTEGITLDCQYNKDINKVFEQLSIVTKVVDSQINGNILVDDKEIEVYRHPTGDGNYHIPANGTKNEGKFLSATDKVGEYDWKQIEIQDVNGLTERTNKVDSIPFETNRISVQDSDSKMYWVGYNGQIDDAEGCLIFSVTEGGLYEISGYESIDMPVGVFKDSFGQIVGYVNGSSYDKPTFSTYQVVAPKNAQEVWVNIPSDDNEASVNILSYSLCVDYKHLSKNVQEKLWSNDKIIDSTINGNISVDGVEITVYKHPTGDGYHHLSNAEKSVIDNIDNYIKTVVSDLMEDYAIVESDLSSPYPIYYASITNPPPPVSDITTSFTQINIRRFTIPAGQYCIACEQEFSRIRDTNYFDNTETFEKTKVDNLYVYTYKNTTLIPMEFTVYF